MRISRLLQLSFCLLIPIHAWAEDFKSELDKTSERIRYNAFTVDRGLAGYKKLLGEPFATDLRNLEENSRWLDVGAGEANAQRDFYATGDQEGKKKKIRMVALSAERPNWFYEIQEFQKQVGKRYFKYLSGKYFEKYNYSELKLFRLITDVFGAFSYSTDASLVVFRILRHLEQNGTAYIVIGEGEKVQVALRLGPSGEQKYTKIEEDIFSIVDQDNKPIPVMNWFNSFRCARAESYFDSYETTKEKQVIVRFVKDCDDIEVPKLELLSYKDGGPPIRKYQITNALWKSQ